jgi:hypothetical protein
MPGSSVRKLSGVVLRQRCHGIQWHASTNLNIPAAGSCPQTWEACSWIPSWLLRAGSRPNAPRTQATSSWVFPGERSSHSKNLSCSSEVSQLFCPISSPKSFMTDLCVQFRLKPPVVGVVVTGGRQRVRFAQLDLRSIRLTDYSFSRFGKRRELYLFCAPQERSCPLRFSLSLSPSRPTILGSGRPQGPNSGSPRLVTGSR